MNSRARIRPFGLLLAAALFLFSPLSRAQDNPEEETKGIDSGNYNTQQSAETGYRATWIDGNQGNYGTFVNLNSGLRLRSEEHTSELQSQSNLVCRLLLEKK